MILKKIYIIIMLLNLTLALNAQVGIGNVPKSGSILDLTNSSDKYLILPITAGDPDTLLTIASSVIYHNNNLYLKTSAGIKVFTPWKWDGDSTHAISSPANSTVGIGTNPAGNYSNLIVSDVPGDLNESTSNASIIVGSTTTKHLFIDNTEIMAKSTPTNAGDLKLQEEGGTVSVRSGASDAGIGTVLTAYGNTDAKGKVRENGNDLIPAGSIFMFSGSSVPPGWALCNGGSYPRQDGMGFIATPDLTGQFVVGADIGGTGFNGTYPRGVSGGSSTCAHTHTVNPLPFTTPSDGTHIHNLSGANNNVTLSGGCTDCVDFDTPSGGHTHTINSSTHTHNIDLPLQTSSGASLTANLPPFYSLAFIIKL